MKGRLAIEILAMLAAAALAGPGDAAAASDAAADPSAEASPVVVEVDDRGFDWADATIGAAAGFGLALLAGGGAVALGLAHDKQPDHRRAGSRGRSSSKEEER